MSRARNHKYDEAASMYLRGMSIGEIALFFGITRQAMHKILIRREVDFRSNLNFKQDNHFYRGGARSSDYAHNALEYALRKGVVLRKASCEQCGNAPILRDGRSGIQAHHCDYNKPLDVMWLCQKCHHEWHKGHKAIPREKGR